jgi:polyferredoxin
MTVATTSGTSATRPLDRLLDPNRPTRWALGVALLVGVVGALLFLTAGARPAILAAAGGTLAALVAALWMARVSGRSEAGESSIPRNPALPFEWRSGILVLVLAGDVILGALVLAGGLAPTMAGVPAPLGGLVALVVSPVFLAVTGIEVLLLAVLAFPGTDRSLRTMLLAQAALIVLTPTSLPFSWWGAASSYLGTALIVAMLVTALQFLYRNKQLHASVLSSVVRWPLAALVTAAAWFLWDFQGFAYPLALAVGFQFAVALWATLGSSSVKTGERVPWLLRPFAVFEFLLFSFLAEFFLGALLDYRIAGPSFLQYIPFIAPGGSGAHVAGVLAYNGLWFAAAILASAWFLIILGFTMGPLVVLKIRETHERPQKYRLGMTIAAYALAAVYIPSFASSTPLANVPWLASLPVIGWGFGLRAGGPFESGIFLAVILMYVSVGVLTVLFGRKAICSVMCGAAMMYQGTAMNEMRSFNQTSKVGRHFLGSQLSTAYVVTSGVALVSLFAISLLALLRWLPAVQVGNGQFDTAALPLPIELYFGGIWFAMFVTTPFIGTYNCATTGFCHWGALTIPFAKVGFFRLKVKDKEVCQKCTTFDCAKACPVGLVDMPLYFRRDGEFRSTKCCGVGDCVGACPYGNMYHQDVRFWLRRKLSGKDPAPQRPIDRGIPLPMVASTAVSHAPTSVTRIATDASPDARTA